MMDINSPLHLILHGTTDTLFLTFVTVWILRDVAWWLVPEVEVDEKKMFLWWPRAPRWYIQRMFKKGPDRIMKSAHRWYTIFLACAAVGKWARIPMIGVLVLDMALAMPHGPGLSTVDLFVDLIWLWILWRELKNDDKWRKRVRDLKERVVATTAGLKVVPVPS